MIYFLKTIFFSLLILPSQLSAQQLSKVGDILVSADQMVRDSQTDRLDLNGSVQIIFQDKHLHAHKVTVDLKSKKFIASGLVSLLTPEMSIDGDRIEMDYVTGNGTIYNGFVRSGNVTFEGDIVRKVGSNEFEIESGSYTACKTCPPAWSFSGKLIKAEIGGYAYITQPFFRIANYPFFWLPYLILPLKSKRQTGFLFPGFGDSQKGGFFLSQSFFWAIDPHKDLTYKLTHFSKRGFKQLVNYRFFADTDSYGEFKGAYLKDKVFNESGRIDSELKAEESIERWFIDYSQYFVLPGDLIQRTQINLVSDIEYITDFPGESDGYAEPALENRLSLTKNFQDWHLSSEAAININLLKANSKEDNDDAVHRLPDVLISMAEKELGDSGWLAKLNINYINFARNNFSFDDITFDSSAEVTKRFNPNRDGEFNFDGTNTRDQIRSGQRFDFQPEISRPFTVGPFLDVVPSFSFRHTSYDFGIGEDPSTERSYLRTELSTRTILDRVYGTEGEDSSRYKHEIIPELTFSYVPFLNQPDHPFFGVGSAEDLPNFRSDQPISDEDFFSDSGLQFDYFDRISDRKVLNYSLTNTLTKKRNYSSEDDSGFSYQQIGLFRLSQSYDFIEAERTDQKPRPWSDIEALLNLRLEKFDTNTVVNYFPYHQVSNISSRVRVNNTRGDFFQFIYSLRYIVGDDLDIDKSTRTENVSAATGYNHKYFNFYGQVDYSLTIQELTSWRYQIALKPPGECWGLIFNHSKTLGGEELKKFSFSYSFDGKTSTSIGDSVY